MSTESETAVSGATNRTWDVIVVGAGAAGAVLAARLSEDPAREVLLLEAGPDYRAAEAPPEMHAGDQWLIADLTRFPQYQWLGLTARATSAQKAQHYPRGRGVGGSTAINWRIAFRPPLDDFLAWEAAGSPAWGPDAVLPSFVRLENDLHFGGEPYHGREGPIPISRLPEDEWSSLDHALRDAAVDRGEPWCPDLNAPGSTGASMLPFNGVEGMRMSTNDAYLEPARDRANLRILGDASVDRIVFNGTRAVAVRAIVDGAAVELRADEIVLSAGAIHSPAILLRSGIGPAAQLQTLGVPVLADLAAGENVQDHVALAVAVPLGDHYRPARSGRPFAVCLRSSTAVDGCAADDLMIQMLSPAALEPFPFSMMGATLEQPFSTGTLRLVSTDPTVNPEVDLRMLSDPRDLERMRLAAARAVELLHQPALEKAHAGPPVPYRVSWEGLPDVSGSFDDLTDPAELDRWILEAGAIGLHASSSCAMGAVVDGDCRVLGTEGLRVADMSIAPVVPRANTNLTAIMIGEHVAGLMSSGAT